MAAEDRSEEPSVGVLWTLCGLRVGKWRRLGRRRSRPSTVKEAPLCSTFLRQFCKARPTVGPIPITRIRQCLDFISLQTANSLQSDSTANT